MFLNHSIPFFFLSLTNWLRLLTFLCWFLTLMLVFLLIRIYFQLLKLGLVYTAFVFSRWLEWFRWTYHSASAAVDEFYEWSQVGIDIYILQQKVYCQVSSIFVVFSCLCSSHYLRNLSFVPKEHIYCLQPISCYWSFSRPPENIRQLDVAWCFQGV